MYRAEELSILPLPSGGGRVRLRRRRFLRFSTSTGASRSDAARAVTATPFRSVFAHSCTGRCHRCVGAEIASASARPAVLGGPPAGDPCEGGTGCPHPGHSPTSDMTRTRFGSLGHVDPAVQGSRRDTGRFRGISRWRGILAAAPPSPNQPLSSAACRGSSAAPQAPAAWRRPSQRQRRPQ